MAWAGWGALSQHSHLEREEREGIAGERKGGQGEGGREREGEREREGGREREREREREGGRERERERMIEIGLKVMHMIHDIAHGYCSKTLL